MPSLRRPARDAGTANVISGSTMFGPVVQAGVVNIQGPLPAVALPAQIRPAISGFTGRDRELDDVLTFLRPAPSAGPGLCVITGMAGVGKTELARQAGEAAAAQGWFPGGVVDLDLHGYDDAPLSAEQALDSALQGLGVPSESIPAAGELRAALYRAEIAARDPVLLVADNAVDPEQIRVLVPAGTRHRLLVTSRHTMAQLDARLIELRVLDKAEALELLEKAIRGSRPEDSRITSDQPSAVQLAELCGYLPLALQIAAALLKRDSGKPVTELAAELADEVGRLHRLDDENRAVLPVFDLSYRQLDPLARQVFRLLSVNQGPDTATDAVAVLTEMPATEVRLVLDRLADAHIVERLTVRDRWRMHDLVRAYARQRGTDDAASDDRDAARVRLLEYYQGEADEAYQRLVEKSGSKYPDRAAAVAWLESERLNLVAATADARAAGQEAISLDLALSLQPYLIARLHLADLLAVCEEALAAARSLGNRAGEVQMILGQAYVLRMSRQLEASEAACRQAITISQESGDRSSECLALTSLGGTLTEAARLEEGLNASRQATEIAQAEGPATVMALSNQALALVQLSRHAEATSLCRRAAELARECDSLDGAWYALNNLAVALIYLEQPTEAVKASQDALAIAEESGDLDHQAGSLGNLSEAFGLARRYKQALETAELAAEVWRSTPNRHRQALAELTLATALTNLGRYQEAEAAGRRAAGIFHDLADARLEGRSLRIAAVALWKLKRADEAVACLNDAIARARSAGDDFAAGHCFDSLGDIQSARRRFRAAAVAYLRASTLLLAAEADRAGDRAFDRLTAALKKLRRLPPHELIRDIDSYPLKRLAMIDLGHALGRVGRQADAATMHEEAVELSRAASDPRAEAKALTAWANSLGGLKRTDEAIGQCRLAISVAAAAGLRRQEASAWGCLGWLLENAGQTADAIAAHRTCVAIRQELGSPYPLAGALTGLGMALCDSPGEEDEAILVLRQAVELCAEIGRQTGARAKAVLAFCLLKQQQLDEAASLAKEAFSTFIDRSEFRQAWLASQISGRARYLRWRSGSASSVASAAPLTPDPQEPDGQAASSVSQDGHSASSP